jgi:hypothetical protein
MRVALALALAAVAVAAPAASAKEGALAHLLSRLPGRAVAGTPLTVRWTVDIPGANGHRVPFGAIGMFVRLVGRTGVSTSATAAQGQPPYRVRIRVPRGGIRAIRFGLHGTSDIFFPLK